MLKNIVGVQIKNNMALNDIYECFRQEHIYIIR